MPERPSATPAGRLRPELFRRTFLKLIASATAGAAIAPAFTRTAYADEGVPSTAPGAYLATTAGPGRFPLVRNGKAAPLVVSGSDYPGVIRVVTDLQADIAAVTGVRPAVSVDQVPAGDEIVLIGTIGKSPLIDQLVSAGTLDVSGIAGQWETSLEQVVDNPLPGVRRAFVIAGSDQRGTIFGAYDVSNGIGVSPWYWWDDVPPQSPQRTVRAARPAHPGHAGREVPGLLHQRREPEPGRLGAGVLRPRPGPRVSRRLQQARCTPRSSS